MKTSSFISGMCCGSGVTALIAQQPDWWIWLVAGVCVVVYEAWEEVNKIHRGK